MSTIIAEKYELSNFEIAKGAQGCIVAGRKLNNKKIVAVKIFKNTNTTLKRELSCYHALKANHSSRCVPVYDWCTQNNICYLIMKQMETDLLGVIQTEKVIQEQKAKKIFYNLCLAVKECHDANIGHLDIKPDNILIDKKQKPYICDFGNSVIGISKNIQGRRGTKIYAAPEVTTEKYYSPREADIWSLGCTLYVMITGYLPNFRECQTEKDYEIAIIEMFLLLNSLKVSEQCVDLLMKIITFAPKRMTLKEILNHPWVSSQKRTNPIRDTLLRVGELARQKKSMFVPKQD